MLKEKQVAPDFKLPMFGGEECSYHAESEGKISVLIFYKFSCPTCQLIMPFLQSIYDAFGDAFFFVAIAQDDAEKTAGFRQDYRISIPTLMDLNPYPVSDSFRIHTVPSAFLVEVDHRIRYSGYGFVKQEILNLADILAEKSGRPQIEVFGDVAVPEIKAG